DERFAKRRQVRPAHRGVLAVDEREILLAVVPAVRERDFDVVTLEMDDRIEGLAAQILLQKILQSVLGLERLAIERERESAVQERVVPQHVLDELGAEPEVLTEELIVGSELHQRAVALVALRDLVVLAQLALFELHQLALAVAKRLRPVLARERVDRLL